MSDVTMPVTGMTRLCALLDRAAGAADLTKAFLVVESETLTYGEALDRMARLNAVFRTKGLGTGDHVGIVTRSPIDMALLLVAGLRAGLVMLNLNPELSETERRHAVGAARLKHLFIDRDLIDIDAVSNTIATTSIDPPVVAGKRALIDRLLGRTVAPTGLRAEIAAAIPEAPANPADCSAIGLMLFTSGTTSQPKVVLLSHANLAAQIETFLKVYDYDASSRILNPLPLHFTDGILHGPLITFITGATLYRPKLFQFQEIGSLLHSIYRDRITHFIVVPALLSLIDRLHEDFTEAFATPDFRYIRSSGDRLPEALWRSVQDRFHVTVVNTYGLSETVCEALYCGPDKGRFKFGTIGKPVDCEIDIIDETGTSVTSGETGELLIRGTNIMAGYLGQPDLTAEAIVDGWFRTGDYAQTDQEGFVSIVGRKKALIISGGANIQPQDIVDAMLEHPSISEAYAVGIPDPLFGEIVACAVVPRRPDDATGRQAPKEADLVQFCRGRLAPNKIPRKILVVEALPRNPAGKILADRVKDMFGDGAPSSNRGRRMRSETIEADVFTVAGEIFGVNPSTLGRTSEPRTTLGWDSFAHVNLVLAIEKQFDIKLSARDVLRIGRLEHLIEIVEQRTAVGSDGA